MRTLIETLYRENDLSDADLLRIIQEITPSETELLFDKAVATKERYYGKAIYMRGLIEMTNHCRRNCLYCGIRSGNPGADRYRLNRTDILATAELGYRLGYRTLVLQGGEDPYFDDDRLERLLWDLHRTYPDIAVTLSLGERSHESYALLKQAGVNRYLLRHETASPALYETLHPGMSFENRVGCLKSLKALGYQVGAGFMVGLPGQTHEDLVMDLRFLKELQPEMVGIGPFITHGETPLKGAPCGTVEATRLMLAIVRLMLPKVLLPSTTALGTLDNRGRELGILSGANVVMPNLTPESVRAKYALYENKICTEDAAEHCRHCIEARIRTTGHHVDLSVGHHYDWRSL